MKSKIIIMLLSAGILASSCNDWLTVSSPSETVADEQFSNEAGFRDAVIGVYIKLAGSELYGKDLTWGCVEFLSQQYALVARSPYELIPQYSYTGSPLAGYVNSIWSAQYNVIANINNILKWQARNPNVMHPVQDSIIRGEMLGLRAFCHLDMMRLYGKGNLANRPAVVGEMTVPYVTEFSRHTPEQYTYKETFEMLFADFELAIAYLEADPIRIGETGRDESYYNPVLHDGFLTIDREERQIRMNYYACIALYARALMWEGSAASRAKAIQLAKSLIFTDDISYNTDWFRWASASNMTNDSYLERDNAFKEEQLWRLYIDKFMEVQSVSGGGADMVAAESAFSAANPDLVTAVAYLEAERVRSVFETESITSDWRYTEGLDTEGPNPSAPNFFITKFRDQEAARKAVRYRNRMPMVRITEMYYIVAECLADSDPAEALRYLNTVRNKRNIPAQYDLQGLTSEQVREEIRKEYMKEFIAEGQLFYYYKRVGASDILGYDGVMDDTKYVLPLPDDEILHGHRNVGN